MAQVIFLFLIFFGSLISNPGFNPFDLIDFLIFVSCVSIGSVFLSLYIDKGLHKSVVRFFLAYVSILFMVVLYTVLSAPNLAGLATFIQHFIFSPLLFLFIAPLGDFKYKNDPILIFLCSTGILIIFFGYVFQGVDIMHYHGLLKANRFSGFLGNPNINATFIYFTWLFCLILLNDMGRLNSAIHVTAVSFPFLFFIILTWSRRVFLVYTFTYVLILFRRTNLLFKALSLLSFFSILGLLISFNFDFSGIDFRSSSTSSRFQELRDSIESLQFAVGAGAGNFGVASQFTTDSSHYRIHNYYLQLLLDYGAILGGMVVFMLFGPIFLSNKKFNILEVQSFHMLKLALLGSFLLGFFGLTNVTFPINIFHVIILGLLIKRFISVQNRSSTAINEKLWNRKVFDA